MEEELQGVILPKFKFFTRNDNELGDNAFEDLENSLFCKELFL